MYQERISAYTEWLKSKNAKKQSYKITAARLCAECFDTHGITTATDTAWQMYSEYVKQSTRKANGKEICERTLENNYLVHAKAFYRWCTEQQQLALSDNPEKGENHMNEDLKNEVQTDMQVNTTAQIEKPVRINFMLGAAKHKKLLILSLLENKTLTDILNEATENYIQERIKKVTTISEALKQAEQE